MTSSGERQTHDGAIDADFPADRNGVGNASADRESGTSSARGPLAFVTSLWGKRTAPVDDESIERAPLLGDAPEAGYGAGQVCEGECDEEDEGLKHAPRTTLWQELVTLAKFALPVIFSATMQQALGVTSLVSVGQIGKVELGAVSLATMSSAMLFNAPVSGLSTSLDTLCAQAYGSGNKHLVGLQMQRMILFLLLFWIPIAICFLNAPLLLSLVVPDPRSVYFAGEYLRILLLGCPGIILFEAGKRFLQAQGLFRATAYAFSLAIPVNIFLNWFLVWKLEMGFHGAPLAVAISQLTLPLGLLAYVVFVDGKQCWGGFSKRAFTNWGHMVRLAVPGMAQVWFEWISFEVLAIMASQFGPDYLAAQTILGCIVTVIYQPPFALGVATATRVAQWIGAGKVKEAIKSAEVGFVASWVVGLIDMALLLFFTNSIARVFTTDPTVLTIIRQTVVIMALMHLADAITASAHSLIRGLGRQKVGGYAAAFMYWVIGLPLAWLLTFKMGWELNGLWTGIGIGLAGVSTIVFLYVWSMDWHLAAREAALRNASN